MPLLDVQDLNVWYRLPDGGRMHAVQDFNLSLDPGQRMGLVGESGCGKTTALTAIMALVPPTAEVSGRVVFDGDDLLVPGEANARKHRWTGLSLVFQGAMNAFNPVVRVEQQIAEPMVVHGLREQKPALARARELLELVGISAKSGRKYPHEFSGGMRQRAMMAMALACDPKVLIADEPTTALDSMVQAQILTLLDQLSDELGLGLLLVTHDLPVVSQLCHSATVMRGGTIVEQGAIADLYHRPAHPYTQELFDATPELYGGPELHGERELITAEAAPAAADAPGPLLEVTDLVTTYSGRGVFRRAPDVRAVDGVTLSVDAGEVLAIVGESGSGKTSTVQTVMRMVDAAAGRIVVEGDDITEAPERRLRGMRRAVQMVYQDPYESLDPRFTVHDTVMEPLLVHERGLSAAERDARILAALETVELTPAADYVDRYPHELSGGQRQRVAIAAALVINPRLLIADEPVSMLDVSIRAGVLELLAGLVQRGLGVIMITHDLATAAHFADRIAVMYLGRIVEEGTAEQVIHYPRHPYTKALLSVVPQPDPLASTTPQILKGETPNPADIPAGCRFRPRCPIAVDACATIDPALEPVGAVGHRAACIRAVEMEIEQQEVAR